MILPFLIILGVGQGVELIGSSKFGQVQERVPGTRYLLTDRKMSAVLLDVAPEHRTEQCSLRFRPCDRFWNQGSDTCRQALKERNVCPYTIEGRSFSSTRFGMMFLVIYI